MGAISCSSGRCETVQAQDVFESSVAFQQMLNVFIHQIYMQMRLFIWASGYFWWFHTNLIAKFAQSNSGERSIVTSHHGQMIGILQQEPKTPLQQRSGGCSDSRDDLYWQACGLLFFLFFSSNSIQTDPNLHRCGFSIKKNMQLSLIIACNLHTAVSDVCTINNVQTSRTKNLSKNLVFGCIKVQRKSKKSARKLYGRGSPQCLVHICTRFWQEPGQRVKIGKC